MNRSKGEAEKRFSEDIERLRRYENTLLPAELDFNAVQRGDAEMEQKVNRVIRACVELGGSNPIVTAIAVPVK